MTLALLGGIAGWHLSKIGADRRRAEQVRDRKPTKRIDFSRTPRVSILVAAWNEKDMIERHIASIFAIDYPDIEFVLCAGGQDGTFALAKAALAGRGTLLEQEPGEGKQRALRRCLTHATGEIVYQTDADCLVDTDSFTRAIEPLIEGKAEASTGRSRPLLEELLRHPYVICQWAPPYFAESGRGPWSHGLLGRNCAVTRDALRRAGDFAADVPTGTDYHLARQLHHAGIQIALVDSSFVSTMPEPSIATYMHQQSRWLRNDWIHSSDGGDRAIQRHVLQTWLIGVLFVGLPMTFPFARWWTIAPWLALLKHGGLSRMRYVQFTVWAEGLPFYPAALLVSPFWFAIDAIAWARSIFDLLVPSRRRRW